MDVNGRKKQERCFDLGKASFIAISGIQQKLGASDREWRFGSMWLGSRLSCVIKTNTTRDGEGPQNASKTLCLY